MKKLAACLVMLLMLTGCDIFKKPEESPTETEPEDTTSIVSETEAETEATSTASEETKAETIIETVMETETVPLSAEALYQEALENLLEEHLFPNGSEAEVKGDISENQFAVYDIDADGREELLISFITAGANDQMLLVYDTDAGELVRELSAYPEAVFYDNGIIEAKITQKMEISGTFTPYILYQYDTDSDGYYEASYVSAVSRSVLESQDMLDEYPEDADESQSGFVYYIGSDNPVDVTEYELWRSAWTEDANIIDVPYMALTKENVEAVS